MATIANRTNFEPAFAALPPSSRKAAAMRIRTAIAQLEAVANALDGDDDPVSEVPIGELAARVLKRFGITDGSEGR